MLVPFVWSPNTAINSLLGGMTAPVANRGMLTLGISDTPPQSLPTTFAAHDATLLNPLTTLLTALESQLIADSIPERAPFTASLSPFAIEFHRLWKKPFILSVAVLKAFVSG